MKLRQRTILQHARDAVEQLGLHCDVVSDETLPPAGDTDVVLKLRHPGGERIFLAEVITRPTPQIAYALAGNEPAELPHLLVADYINPKLAELLRKKGVNFMDAAGNAYLRDRGLLVLAKGEKDRLRFQAEREQRRAFQPSGLKLLFVLLCRPDLAESSYRVLAKTADVALGTVQWVMRDLMRDGYMLRLGKSSRRLVEPQRLLEDWAPAYARDLRPRLLQGRFEAKDLSWWRETDPRNYEALWGGEPAAALLTQHLRPGSLTLYSDHIPTRIVIKENLNKKEVGRIEFRRKFWRFNSDPQAQTVPPVLVYADLLALADPRARESAERIHEEIIDGSFRTHLARWSR